MLDRGPELHVCIYQYQYEGFVRRLTARECCTHLHVFTVNYQVNSSGY